MQLQCGGRCCGREAEVHKSRLQEGLCPAGHLPGSWAGEKMEKLGDIRIGIRCIAVYCVTSPSTLPDRSRLAEP
jgi:hypothetical protein